MKSPSSVRQPYKNLVLASLPGCEIERLAPHLTPVTLATNRNLHDASKIIDRVYFLEDGVSSVVVSMKDGTTVEVGLIGRDGVVGLPAVLGSGHSPNSTFIQLPGYGFSIKAQVLRERTEASSELRFCL